MLTTATSSTKCKCAVGVTSSALSSICSLVTVLVNRSSLPALIAAPATFVSKLLLFLLNALVCCVGGVIVMSCVVVCVVDVSLAIDAMLVGKSVVGVVMVIEGLRTLP